MSEGEVGRVGMAVDTLRDFEIALRTSGLIRLEAGLQLMQSHRSLLAMYQAVPRNMGLS
jgi:methylmalonyl-CoA mutase N-terminal domain/subunit